MKCLKMLTAIGVLTFANLAGPALAQEVEAGPVEEKKLISGKQEISDEKAYIFTRSHQYRSYGAFIKTPDQGDVDAYEAEWRKKLAKAQKKFPSKLSRYQRDLWLWNETKRKNRKPIEPVEPTEENFSIGPIEQKLVIGFGPQYVFSKGKDDSEEKYFTYLHEVEPGEYTYYGEVLVGVGAVPGGMCMCMGSVKFDARAGEIVNFGDFLQQKWVDDDAARLAWVFADLAEGRIPKPVDYSLPASLEEYPHGPSELRAAGKMNNFFGLLIGRMPPIAGVLGYDRDTVLDLKVVPAKNEMEEMPMPDEASSEEAEIPSEGDV